MKRIDRGDSAVEKGFTLIEILIALALMSLVTTAIYSFYISQYKTWISQDLITEMQQNGRVAIDTISRDLLLTGYGTTVAIEEGTQNKIAVLYKDPTVASKFTRVMYWKSPQNELKRYEKNGATVTALGTINWSIGGTTLGEDVTSLEFAYFDKNGNMTVTPQGSPNEPYRVKVTIKLQTSRDDPLKPGTRKHFTLSTDIRPRNIGITGIASDTNPPAPPTGLQVVDPGVCGTLWVKWTPNTEADLASYTIYYGQATGVYTATVSVSRTGMDNNPVGEYYALTGLTRSKSNGTSTVTYYIKVVAVDTSGNASKLELSTEVGNDPNADPVVRSTNIRTFGAGNDTTVDIPKPSAPTGFTGVDIATENQVKLTWDASADPNVIGYRLYRRESAFGTFPVCATLLAPADCTGTQANTVRVADESIIGAGATSFLDKNTADSASDVATLLGCTTYYYALAPVTCDTTLIPDDGGDDATKRYVASNYGLTYGDGPDKSGTDSPANSDTAPRDDTDPAAPTIFGVKAGWQRVAVSLNQSSSGDTERTCVYVRESGDYPVLRTDTATYPLVSGCYQLEPASGQLVPDSNGSFTVPELALNQSTAFWHDSMSAEEPGTPQLAPAGIYSYRAVTMDLCGNGSNLVGAQDTITLCGEDPPVCTGGGSDPSNCVALANSEPPAVTGLSASACSTPVTLRWTKVPSVVGALTPSAENNPYDLAGYRILKNPNNTDWSSADLLNENAPFWGEEWGDTAISEGSTYYYRVVSTDCPYERPITTATAEATIRADMLGGASPLPLKFAEYGPVTPGMIDRDGGAVAAATDHLEILTLDSRGEVTSDPTMGYHNKVKLYLRNTSAGVMTITGIPDIRWGNTSAMLAKVLIGGFEYAGNNNTTTQRTVWEATSAAGLLGACTTTPSDLCSASVTFSTPMEIGASDLHVPIIFEFRDAAYGVNESADMAGDSVFRMTLKVTNNSTNTTGCNTYLTTNRQDAPIPVPTGPVMSGTVQNRTATDYSSSSTVQGYWYLGVGLNVNVITNVSDSSGVGISSVKLYYAVTERTVTSAPTLFSDYTPITMSLVSGQYKTSSPIPAQANKRIWYYIVAKDIQGNFDREPAIQNGFYTYDQPPLDPCSVTPVAPNPLTLGTYLTNGYLSVKWPVVTQYTNGGTIDKTVDKITYQIWRRDTPGGTFKKLYDGVSAEDNNTYSCNWTLLGDVDGAGPSTEDYIRPCSDKYEFFDSDYNVLVKNFDLTYYIVAKNSCSATGNLSSNTNTYSECIGAGATTLTVSPTTLQAGSSYTVTVSDCGLATDATVNTITIGNIASTGGINYPLTLTETTATSGLFIGTIGTSINIGDAASKVYVSAGDFATDTITVSCSSGCAGAPTPATVTVSAASCDNTPAAPANLRANVAPNCGSDRNMQLIWNANAETDVIGYDVYQITPAGVVTPVCSTNSRTTVNCTANTSDTGKLSSKSYQWVVKAKDSCATPKVSAASNTYSDPCP